MRPRKRLSSVLVAVAVAAGTTGLVAARADVASAGPPQAQAAAPSTIRYGDRNWSVVCLQEGLNYYAFITGGRVLPAGGVDGIFGQATLSSVRSLQVYFGRRVTGVVDRTSGEDLVAGLWHRQGPNAGVKDWLRYCQHTIPHRTQYHPT